VPQKTRKFIDLKSLARGYTQTAIKTLGGLSEAADSDATRVAASIALLDRGWGKPKQVHQHGGGEEGEGPIVVKIVYGKDDED
jgi:hypothetical protein